MFGLLLTVGLDTLCACTLRERTGEYGFEASMNVSHFKIEERQEASGRRLTLTGELDIAAVPVLEERLEQLRADHAVVRLDLAQLQFIDSSGLHLLLRCAEHAREDGWAFEINRDVSSAVKRLFELAGVERLLGSHGRAE
jgi:anti-anti-sigma factor